MADERTSYARSCYKNGRFQRGRLSICHATPPSEPDEFATEDKQASQSTINIQLLPSIMVDGEPDVGSFNNLTEREISYDYSRLNPGNTLDAAVAQNNSDLLKKILASTATVSLDGLNASGGTAIHEAAFQGKVSCLKVFIKFGADVNLRDKEGWTLLHAAICGGDADSVLMLLRSGASVNALTYDGVRPIEMAWQCGDQRIIKMLSNVSTFMQNDCKEQEGIAPLASEESFNSNVVDFM